MLAALAISTASPLALSEIGTSFTDLPTALPVLAGLALLSVGLPSRIKLLACGALVGCAMALKLTNAIYVVALVVMCLGYGPAVGRRLASVIWAGSGAVLGFLLMGGWWCATLWARFGNPFFPYFNSIFRSPDFPPTSDIDHRYLPHGIFDALAYPFRWVVGIVPTAEIGFSDIRFAVLLVVLAAVACAALLGHAARRDGGSAARLVTFWVACLVVWVGIFAIQRYLIVAELLCGPIALVLIGRLALGWIGTALCSALALGTAVTMRVPDWGHIPFQPRTYMLVVPPALEDDGLFFIAGAPLSYVIPAFSLQARFFGIMEWEEISADAHTRLTNRIQQDVAAAGIRKLRVIANAPWSVATRWRLGSYGVQPTGTCQPVPGIGYAGHLMVCDLAHTGNTGAAAQMLEPGQTIDFGKPDQGFPLLTATGLTDWRWPGPIPDSRGAAAPGLIFRRSPRFIGPATLLRIVIAGDVPSGITLGGVPPAVRAGPDPGTNTLSACLPPSATAGDTITAAFQAPGVMRFRLLDLTVDAAPACP